MPLEILAGRVSHATRSATTSGEVEEGRGRIYTSESISFRVNGRQVRLDTTPGNISDGDLVTVVGSQNKGIIYWLCFRNETTGLLQRASTGELIVGGAFMLVGIPLLVILVGVPLVILGLIFLSTGVPNKKANEMLLATPSAARSNH